MNETTSCEYFDDYEQPNSSSACESESSLQLLATQLRSKFARQRREGLAQLVALTVLLGGLSVFGALGNSFTLYIYGRKLQRTTSNLLIFTLGAIDLLINLLVIPANLVDSWKLELYTELTCRLQELLKSAALFASTLTIVIIAVDRALILCFVPAIRIPLKHLKLLILAALVFALLCASPAALAVSVYFKVPGTDSPVVDSGLRFCLSSDRYVSVENMQHYWQIVAIVYLAVVAVLIGCYSSILTCICAKRSQICRSFQSVSTAVLHSSELCVHKPSVFESPNTEHTHLNGSKAADYEANENISMIELHLPIFDGIISEEMRATQQKRSQTLSDCSDSGLQSASATNSCAAIGAKQALRDNLPCCSSHLQISSQSSAASSSWLLRPIRKISYMTNNGVDHEGSDSPRSKKERRSKKSAANSTGGRSRIAHLKTLKVLAIISATFVLSYTPTMIYNLGLPTFGDGNAALKRGAGLLLYYLYHLQSAINPVRRTLLFTLINNN